MIYARIALRNIWYDEKKCPFKSYWCKHWALSKNKTAEAQFSRYAYNLAEITVELNWRGSDHAGPAFEINLFGYTLNVAVNDNRHWDHDTNTWEVYDAN